MSNDSTNKLSLIEFPELPDSVDHAVENLTDYVTKNAGQTFGDIWFLIFGGISHIADKRRMKYANDLETYHKELVAKIDSIPPEEKIEPSIQVTAQALENSKYCVSEPELREMFVNLISCSMDNRMSHTVHPSFPEIIKQMAPIDAKIISTFAKDATQPIANFVLKNADNTKRPLANYVFYKSDNSFSLSYSEVISSLERLGLLSVSFDLHISDSSKYKYFEELPFLNHLKETYENASANQTVVIEKGYCSLTPLGQSFVSVCISHS